MSTVTTPLKKEQDWADISDDEEEEQAPTVKVDADTDSLNLNSLSLTDNDKQHVKPEKSLADRISLGDETTTTTKTNHQEPEKGSSTKTAKTEVPPLATEDKPKEAKEQETNLIQSKYEVAVKLQDLQADPNSPLYSVKSFEELGLYGQIFLTRDANLQTPKPAQRDIWHEIPETVQSTGTRITAPSR